MGLDTADEPEQRRVERHASWAKLFFDLVAAAGVATLTHVFGTAPDAAGLGLYTLLYLTFWLSWTTFMLYSNVAAMRFGSEVSADEILGEPDDQVVIRSHLHALAELTGLERWRGRGWPAGCRAWCLMGGGCSRNSLRVPAPANF